MKNSMKKQHRNTAQFEPMEYDFLTGEFIPAPRQKNARTQKIKTYRPEQTDDRTLLEMEYKAIKSMYPLAVLILIIYLLKWFSEN